MHFIFKGLAFLLEHKVFVSEPTCLLNAANCDTFCFDKTGTLTKDEVYVHGLLDLQDAKLIQTGKDFHCATDELIQACLACNSLAQRKSSSEMIGDKLELSCFK